jgi:hypothetical protein
MADNKRTTSFAKEIELGGHQPNSLDDTPELSDAFRVPASPDYYESNYSNDSDTGRSSDTLRDHAPRAEKDMRPTDEFAYVVDRETFEARQAQEHEAALEKEAYLDTLEQDLEAQEAMGNGRDRDNDYGM